LQKKHIAIAERRPHVRCNVKVQAATRVAAAAVA